LTPQCLMLISELTVAGQSPAQAAPKYTVRRASPAGGRCHARTLRGRGAKFPGRGRAVDVTGSTRLPLAPPLQLLRDAPPAPGLLRRGPRPTRATRRMSATCTPRPVPLGSNEPTRPGGLVTLTRSEYVHARAHGAAE
jgi:hypothetical protein